MFTILPSINSVSSVSTSSSRTLCNTKAKGSRILLLEKIRQKSFLGVGPYGTISSHSNESEMGSYLELKDIPDAIYADQD